MQDQENVTVHSMSNPIFAVFLWQVKKSIVASEMASTRSSAGQAAGNTKSSLTKTPAV